ncbi:hypothetical protein SAMN04488028_11444 [Reichenbachiella agariperforans]|uniref:Uncharacterized protein n=1 Tax=Reichenbachiella agariperforans TaxID=156994 RepID=A0A1M6WSA1_REIAG|nr:hypothetical protein SAMN04488028_11444 [Reichenbachiella agariperforans]
MILKRVKNFFIFSLGIRNKFLTFASRYKTAEQNKKRKRQKVAGLMY